MIRSPSSPSMPSSAPKWTSQRSPLRAGSALSERARRLARSRARPSTPGRSCEPQANRPDEGQGWEARWLSMPPGCSPRSCSSWCLLASGIAARRFLLERGGGTVDCGLRRVAGYGLLAAGVASYQDDQLYWYHQFRILLRPRLKLQRRTLIVASRRLASRPRARAWAPGGRGGVQGRPRRHGRAGDVGRRPHRLPVLAGSRSARFLYGPNRLTDVLSAYDLGPGSARRDRPPPEAGPAQDPGLPARVDRDAQGVPRPRLVPPGFHSTSPCSALACRPRMNSRSDSRFRYRAASGFTVSPCSCPPPTRSAPPAASRSAPCAAAPRPGVPPGSTKLRSTGRSSLYRSQPPPARSM